MKPLRILLIICIVATLAFIWGHSIASRETSSAESGKVKGIIDGILVDISGNSQIGISEKIIRKAAHFFEYAVLGAEVTLFLLLFYHDRNLTFPQKFPFRIFFQSGLFSLCVAAIDETIQFFSGRYPSVFDVLLDFAGAVFAGCIVIVSYKMIGKRRDS